MADRPLDSLLSQLRSRGTVQDGGVCGQVGACMVIIIVIAYMVSWSVIVSDNTMESRWWLRTENARECGDPRSRGAVISRPVPRNGS